MYAEFANHRPVASEIKSRAYLQRNHFLKEKDIHY